MSDQERVRRVREPKAAAPAATTSTNSTDHAGGPLRPTPVVVPAPVLAPDRLRWMALRYSLPQSTSRIRSAVWRELVDLEAINLQYGVWALPYGRDEDRVEVLFERIRDAGGTVQADVVGHDTMTDVELQSRLTQACEHLWDEFSIAADWFGAQLASGQGTLDEQLAGLDDLRARFGAVMMRDVLGSDASGRASARLDGFTLALLGDEDPATRPSGRPLRRRVEVAATWVLESGALRAAARILPVPDIRWERACEHFETVVYQPSARRVPLRHGTFTWTTTPDELSTVLESLDRRLDQFTRYLA